MTTHSSILAWEIPRTEETGRLQSMGSQESDILSNYTTTPRIYKITEVACVGGSCRIPVKQYCFRLHILPLQSCRVCFIPTASFLLLEPFLLLSTHYTPISWLFSQPHCFGSFLSPPFLSAFPPAFFFPFLPIWWMWYIPEMGNRKSRLWVKSEMCTNLQVKMSRCCVYEISSPEEEIDL